MLRVVFTSPSLADFQSLGADDHIKLFFPTGKDRKTCMRDYTPRAYDRDACSLVVDFALHGADTGHEVGPATAWALAAKVGDQLEIGGPRGSMVVADDFGWYLLIADETGLPSIARRLEGLRAGVPVTSIVVVSDDADVQRIETKAAWDPHWVFRGGGVDGDADLLKRALDGITMPPGDGYVWIAAEVAAARMLRDCVLNERHHPSEWMRCAGYWQRGKADSHENLA